LRWGVTHPRYLPSRLISNTEKDMSIIKYGVQGTPAVSSFQFLNHVIILSYILRYKDECSVACPIIDSVRIKKTL